MTDQELLEKAAISVGYHYGEAVQGPPGMMHAWSPDPDDPDCDGFSVFLPQWNPLLSDGDAFRLMVDHGMKVHCMRGEINSTVVLIKGERVLQKTNESGCCREATRRAIVRAAASMADDQ